MKNKIDYAATITNTMTSNVSEVVKVQEYTLDDLTIIIKDLSDEEKEQVLGEIINNQLLNLKKNATIENVRKVFKEVEDATDYFIKYYEDDSDIVSECDDIADDLLFKTLGKNNRTLELPINISYIKNYCLSSNIKDNQLYDSLVWIALRLVAISYCIKFSDGLEKDKNE